MRLYEESMNMVLTPYHVELGINGKSVNVYIYLPHSKIYGYCYSM